MADKKITLEARVKAIKPGSSAYKYYMETPLSEMNRTDKLIKLELQKQLAILSESDIDAPEVDNNHEVNGSAADNTAVEDANLNGAVLNTPNPLVNAASKFFMSVKNDVIDGDVKSASEADGDEEVAEQEPAHGYRFSSDAGISVTDDRIVNRSNVNRIVNSPDFNAADAKQLMQSDLFRVLEDNENAATLVQKIRDKAELQMPVVTPVPSATELPESPESKETSTEGENSGGETPEPENNDNKWYSPITHAWEGFNNSVSEAYEKTVNFFHEKINSIYGGDVSKDAVDTGMKYTIGGAIAIIAIVAIWKIVKHFIREDGEPKEKDEAVAESNSISHQVEMDFYTGNYAVVTDSGNPLRESFNPLYNNTAYAIISEADGDEATAEEIINTDNGSNADAPGGVKGFMINAAEKMADNLVNDDKFVNYANNKVPELVEQIKIYQNRNDNTSINSESINNVNIANMQAISEAEENQEVPSDGESGGIFSSIVNGFKTAGMVVGGTVKYVYTKIKDIEEKFESSSNRFIRWIPTVIKLAIAVLTIKFMWDKFQDWEKNGGSNTEEPNAGQPPLGRGKDAQAKFNENLKKVGEEKYANDQSILNQERQQNQRDSVEHGRQTQYQKDQTQLSREHQEGLKSSLNSGRQQALHRRNQNWYETIDNANDTTYRVLPGQIDKSLEKQILSINANTPSEVKEALISKLNPATARVIVNNSNFKNGLFSAGIEGRLGRQYADKIVTISKMPNNPSDAEYDEQYLPESIDFAFIDKYLNSMSLISEAVEKVEKAAPRGYKPRRELEGLKGRGEKLGKSLIDRAKYVSIDLLNDSEFITFAKKNNPEMLATVKKFVGAIKKDDSSFDAKKEKKEVNK